MEIRDMTPEDIDAVAELEKDNFSTPWKREDFTDLLDRQDRGCVVAKEDGAIIGCVVYHNIVGDVDITNVQVKETFRRRGIGRALMKAAIEKSRSVGGENFTLEVRAGNKAAISLYESLGFKIEGTRRNFYSDPVEDALIMWLRK